MTLVSLGSQRWRFLAQGPVPIARESADPRGQAAAEESGVELNTKARYAVMAMADLAKYGMRSSVPLSAVAERQGLSLAYLEQIFLRLRRTGLVASARGRSGGYVLTRPASDIHIDEIMRAMEEGTRLTRCLDAEAGCVGDRRCLTHGLWHALGAHIDSFLANVTLQEVIDGTPLGKPAETQALDVQLQRRPELVAR
jgi:Rrf2 family protein